ncbi:nucleoside-diphosphate sugar epimerase/dehydratase [Sphingobium sp. BS19]|uniref:polysaccharide biosynthesis protein n=1 Tax=Sphingobium sp. BS19 TaxID=3018973 RepID=UPI0022EE4BCE|nr:nucleoside-diphosphate sugar epimerase/dehydratase [Sphingobium sp. BS19]GLI99991.1 capsular polysaccharide biosynthesis protein [Sphingobium sp. BS19]
MPIAGVSSALLRKWRKPAYFIYDAMAIAASLWIALSLRMNGDIPPHMLYGMLVNLPVFIISGTTILFFSGTYNRLWRLASFPDFVRMIEASVFAIAIPVAVMMLSGNGKWMPTSVPFIQALVLISLLAGGRLWQRVLRAEISRFLTSRGRHRQNSDMAVSQQRVLLAGRPEYVENVLRHFEMINPPPFLPVGILDIDGVNTHLRLRGVPIMGGIDAVQHAVATLTARNERPTSIILATGPDDWKGGGKLKLVTAAQTLHLSVLRAPTAPEMDKPLRLEAINIADLLDRPQAHLDANVVSRAIRGEKVLITGAGGSIGRELVGQIAGFGPSEMMLLDCCEYNLYAIEMELRENYPDILCRPILCSIRQRQHVMAVFAQFRPAFVFHAAALKHVPMVEINICSGVQTNVIGTRNVADAAKRHGVRAMVQVSTDKAVNPVGVMGATKRLGELYCQALDLEGARRPNAPRFMTVRFGNVLGSSGSLIPLFQRQLDRRAPLTVTHPEITRYFMTVHEAVQLILHSTARAMEYGLKRGRIIVLDMGEPVKIIDIARRMIRLAGLIPERDVPIQIVGLRPGEKLYEELFDEREQQLPSELPGVLEAEPVPATIAELQAGFDILERSVLAHNEDAVRSQLFSLLNQVTRGASAATVPDNAADEPLIATLQIAHLAKNVRSSPEVIRQSAAGA